MPRIVGHGAPVWGVLRWIVVLDRARWRLRTCMIAAGTAFDSAHEMQHPEGKTIRSKVDHISLMSGGSTVDLSDVYYAVVAFVRAMETTLASSFADALAFGSDLVSVLEMQIVQE